ncbi:hypothetical protein OG874_00360 [Nocardia sp. NBC_00565]|uniref:hypothetical protein n=1 Tax=Nocardia sp. NBC_00565 TaxID=2975993 RepID=UPI002E802A64|nr:hypothetical protein [Nocardia sp. NBC_00565]WUC03707.1 hypothetical protein OG874_00360 [Nocardia sp. NBC_00565]
MIDPDDRIAELRRLQQHWLRESDRQRTAEMEAELAAVPKTGPDGIPLPSTCHPYYAQDRARVLSWLDGTLGYGSRDRLTIPRMPVLKAADFFKPIEPQATLKTDELERRKFRAPAPYVGEPYELWWSAGVDRRGRAVAGEIRYEFLVVKP